MFADVCRLSTNAQGLSLPNSNSSAGPSRTVGNKGKKGKKAKDAAGSGAVRTSSRFADVRRSLVDA
jgi:hypothetical protein